MMKSKKLISAILAAASIAGGVVGAQAQTIEGLENKVDTYTSRVQQAETKIQDLQTKVDALDTTGIANNKAGIEANKKAIDKQGADISKLQKNADKQHWQIDTLEKKTGVNTPLTNGASNLSAGVNENTRKIDAEATARENAVNGLQSQVTTQGAQISQLQKDMAQEGMDRAAEMDKLTTKVNQKADKVDVEANKNNIASNAAAIKTETQKRENAVNGLQNQVTVASGRIDNLKNQVTENKGAIEKLQTQWNDSNRAFNAEQVNKIDANEKRSETNKNDITTIFGQLNQGAYNTQDGYAIKKDDTIGGALKNLDKNADKQHWQIEALEKKTGINTPLTNGAGNLSAGVNENTRKIDAETDARIDADNKLSGRIDANKTAIENEATARKDEDQKLQTQINSNKQQISQNQKNIEKNGIKADTALKVAGNGVLYNHATNLTDGVNLNTKGVNENAKKIDAEATARKDEDQKLQNNIDKEAAARIAGDDMLNSRIDQVASDANKGIAKASALAALHPLDYDPDNKFDIAAAGGFYKGENAFALGAFYRPNRNVMLSMGTTLTGGDNAYNVGLTFKIGKSGKHTEAGLTTADLYAMIGAMQDKMDQQQKKIEELEAKQAK
ncbi:MAG: hypothetical protein EGR19_09565 [Dialister sp.]|nr:hypothetical protein [Dialister sp.]